MATRRDAGGGREGEGGGPGTTAVGPRGVLVCVWRRYVVPGKHAAIRTARTLAAYPSCARRGAAVCGAGAGGWGTLCAVGALGPVRRRAGRLAGRSEGDTRRTLPIFFGWRLPRLRGDGNQLLPRDATDCYLRPGICAHATAALFADALAQCKSCCRM
ncbi:hypothetical protein PHLGIDRAFT_446792 [Phlebiopsis gigantea 11061_1 CR5-6]|uniref:Uncharacterized protein n=1 Tax=Phlebiopsis gigantea (strain 11061_1 CR5-6) TaxID=745531 RepID=A0A0C3RXQ0_PHLG1|nr:hypothetical protein PHLGIDRAFT_446792 [Phlebiopsis gigantea 11061_1 CR5-6]